MMPTVNGAIAYTFCPGGDSGNDGAFTMMINQAISKVIPAPYFV